MSQADPWYRVSLQQIKQKNQKQQSKDYRRRRIQFPELTLDSNVQCLANNHKVYKEARKYGPFK